MKANESPYAKIELTQGQYCLVDLEDWEWLSKYSWCAARVSKGDGFVAMTNIPHKKRRQQAIRMHTIIMKPPRGMVVDHINHDTLDNRKSNLRVCTKQQNRFNSLKSSNNMTGFKGITLQTQHGKYIYYRVRPVIGGKRIDLGLFKNLREAVEVYNLWARENHKDFAVLNEI